MSRHAAVTEARIRRLPENSGSAGLGDLPAGDGLEPGDWPPAGGLCSGLW